MDEAIIKRINDFYEMKNKTDGKLDVDVPQSQFIKEGLQESMNTLHPIHERFALSYFQPIAFSFGLIGTATMTRIIKGAFKAEKYRLRGLADVILPVMFGASTAAITTYVNDNLFKLNENCVECFRLKMTGVNGAFPCLNSFLFTSLMVWMSLPNERKSIFQIDKNHTYGQHLKKLWNNYNSRMLAGRAYRKGALVTVLFSTLAYLNAIEQEREFIIVFTKYLSNLLYEQDTMSHGLFLDKDAKI